MHRSHWYGLAALAALVVTGCASGPTVRVDKDPAADLSTYKTFGFFEQVATDRAQYSTIVTSHLKQATAAELRKLGYVYDEASPQLRVNFFVKVANKQEIRSTPAGGIGPYRYRFGFNNIESREYKAGTLGIELVDMGRQALVWQGIAEGRLDSETARNSGAAINAAVAEIFRNFPNAPVG